MRSVHLGLLGFGTVGQSLVRLVHERSAQFRKNFDLDLVWTVIANRDVDRKRAAWAGENVRWTSRLEEVVAAPDVDIVVELMGGVEPARTLVRQALSH